MFRRIIDFFFIYVVLEGAVRKWVAPDLSLEIQSVRDLLPWLALIVFALENRRLSELGRLGGAQTLWLGAYIACAFLSLLVFFFSSNLPLFVAAVGFRTHFAYLPLAVLMPAYLGLWSTGLRKIRMLLLLSVPVFLFCFFQFTQPMDSVWNKYADAEMQIASFGTLQTARVTSTFSYLSGLSQFAQICGGLAFLILVLRRRGPGDLVLGGAVLLMSIGAIMASGSRGPLAMLVVYCTALMGLGTLVGAVRMRKAAATVMTVILLALVGLVLLRDQFQAFAFRTEMVGTSDIGWRMYDFFFQWIDVALQYPFGIGIGSGHQALVDVVAGETPNIYEAELSRIAFELGIGVFAYLGAKLTLIAQMLGGARHAASRETCLVLLSCVLSLGLLLPGSVYAPVTNVAFWSVVGLGLWVLQLEEPVRAAMWQANVVQGRSAARRGFVGRPYL